MNNAFSEMLGQRDATLKFEAAERYAAAFVDAVRSGGNICPQWLYDEIFEAFRSGCVYSASVDMESNQEMLAQMPGDFLDKFLEEHIRRMSSEELMELIARAHAREHRQTP